MQPHRRQPTRVPRPWDSPGKNTGVGCHVLLQIPTSCYQTLLSSGWFHTGWQYTLLWASQVVLVVKNPPANAGDSSSTPGPGRSPGRGRGKLLQYSCLKNPLDRGAWRATVHGVTQSQTRLKWLGSNSRHPILGAGNRLKPRNSLKATAHSVWILWGAVRMRSRRKWKLRLKILTLPWVESIWVYHEGSLHVKLQRKT